MKNRLKATLLTAIFTLLSAFSSFAEETKLSYEIKDSYVAIVPPKVTIWGGKI